MISDIVTLVLSVLGLIFLLLIFVARIAVCQSEKFTVAIPLYFSDPDIYSRVYQLYSLFEILGLHKKCTIVLVNYGASDDFCNEIQEFYKNYDFIRIIDSCDLSSRLF